MATVAVSMVAWLAISNHCVLGALDRTARAGLHACCADPAPAKEKTPETEGVCCKLLQATMAKSTQAIGHGTSAFVWLQYFVASPFLKSEVQRAALPEELDTGPPVSFSFAESVLQRSVLTHAPPVFA